MANLTNNQFAKKLTQEKKMIKQMTKMAAMIILAIGFTTSAAAQSKTNDDLIRIIPLTGIETAIGTYDPLTNMVYGNSFVLNNLGGSETHLFTISLDYSRTLDYTCEHCDVVSRFPVIGGSWSLVVFRNNVYAGTLFGKVSGGAIDAVTASGGEPAFRQMQINLQATGGLKSFAGRRSANISGVFEAVTDTSSNQTTGNITFGL
jgi:hypothetical protein